MMLPCTPKRLGYNDVEHALLTNNPKEFTIPEKKRY